MIHAKPNLRFSLVLATVGRTREPARFLESLAGQTRADFELVVVDQNEDERLAPVLAPYRQRFPILHMRSKPGLSRARNAALAHVKGDVVAFPDDDCWYPSGLLETVAGMLRQHEEWDGLTCRVVDQRGRPSVARWDSRAGILKATNVWRRACSISIFLRRSTVDRVGRFDEGMGVGSGTPFGGGEETDYLLRAIRLGCRLYYDPTVSVGHPSPTLRYDAQALARARSYGRGHGRLLSRHPFPLWFKLHMCLRPLGGSLLCLLQGRLGKARFHLAVFRGRLAGWRAKDKPTQER